MDMLIIEKIKSDIETISEFQKTNGNELHFMVAKNRIADVCRYAVCIIDASLMALFAIDERSISNQYTLNYCFSLREQGVILIFQTGVSEQEMEINTICSITAAASLYEREIYDGFGIKFAGTPDSREMLYHGNNLSATFPMRKDFDNLKMKASDKNSYEFLNVSGTGVFEVPVGPVHAGVIEPGHFRFSVAGEPIINLEAQLYYVHKGIEKTAETSDLIKSLFLSERISGDETVSNSLAFCQALENAVEGEPVPDRALYLRTILCELERIYNHIGDIAGICTDVAYGFAAAQFNMMRRWCLMVNEELTGSRFLRSSVKPGGVRNNFIRGKEDIVLKHLIKLENEFKDTMQIIRSNSMFIDRVENTGIIKPEIAKDLNAVGPAGRSAGLHIDVRKDYPYAAYQNLKFNVPVHLNGDVACRMNVKAEELIESCSIIRQCIEKMPDSEKIRADLVKLKPYSSSFGMTESPRGENVHWIMADANNRLFRYKVRTPSFSNWPVLCHAVKGNLLPDFPLINKSFNLSYSGNDL